VNRVECRVRREIALLDFACRKQVANLACVERLGFGIRVRKSHNPSRKVQETIAKLLKDQGAKVKAAAFAEVAGR
jgi:hypothetical protein